MSKIKLLLALSLFGASSVATAQTGTSGSSGSAGLGIDTAALTVVSGGGNPAIAFGKGAGAGMGGPVTGLARHFQCSSASGGILCEKK